MYYFLLVALGRPLAIQIPPLTHTRDIQVKNRFTAHNTSSLYTICTLCELFEMDSMHLTYGESVPFAHNAFTAS